MDSARELKPQFEEMLRQLQSLPGGEIVNRLADALARTEPSVAVRVNARKADLPAGRRMVPWAERGFYVDGDRPRFTMDPALHQGRYYVQDASSMVIGQIVKQLSQGAGPLVYIDACAAPGGKTTAAIDALPEGSFVIANEYDRHRADALVENVVKWGYADCVVAQGDTSRFRSLRAIADIVAVDAPCSGEGMMRKEQAAVEQWSPGLVEQCARLQRDILDNMWEALRPGGYLIYSTCTFNRSENEDNLQYLVDELGGEPVAIDLPDGCGIASGIATDCPAYRFLPGRVEGEGLFAAVVRKPGDAPREQLPLPRKRKPHSADSLIKSPEDFTVAECDGKVVAVSNRWSILVEKLLGSLRLIYVATELCEIKAAKKGGKKDREPSLVPLQSLALSTILSREAFAAVEVDYPTAVAYLRGEAIRLDSPEKGYLLLTYGGHPLGFVKNLGNRANNLYPDPWKIRSTHIPDTPPSLL